MYYDGEYCMVSRREIAGRILTVQRETGRLKTVFQTALTVFPPPPNIQTCNTPTVIIPEIPTIWPPAI